jgi:hypothetical protein
MKTQLFGSKFKIRTSLGRFSQYAVANAAQDGRGLGSVQYFVPWVDEMTMFCCSTVVDRPWKESYSMLKVCDTCVLPAES